MRKARLIDLLHRLTLAMMIFRALNKPDFWRIEACVVPIQKPCDGGQNAYPKSMDYADAPPKYTIPRWTTLKRATS